MKCAPCRGEIPGPSEIEIQELHPLVPDWSIRNREGIPNLVRVFPFKNFSQSLAFTNKVGEIAGDEGHHPAILTEYTQTTVSRWTHSIKGLHRNDFIMAARTDKL